MLKRRQKLKLWKQYQRMVSISTTDVCSLSVLQQKICYGNSCIRTKSQVFVSCSQFVGMETCGCLMPFGRIDGSIGEICHSLRAFWCFFVTLVTPEIPSIDDE